MDGLDLQVGRGKEHLTWWWLCTFVVGHGATPSSVMVLLLGSRLLQGAVTEARYWQVTRRRL